MAQGIATLWWVMLWGGVAIFTFMMVLFLWLWLRPDSGRRVPTVWWVAGGGIAFPLPVIVILTGVALWQGERALGGTAPLKIEAEAVMWEWRFSYPDTDMAPTVNRMHMPAGRDVEIVVTSPDVIHSFWVPRLGGKIDAIPGHANTIVLHADRAGDFGGVCAEYCGVGHQDMDFTVTAHDEWPVQQ